MTTLSKSPFVLVHGAFHGGWCWAPVARILRSHGHEVFTPTQTGLGERRHLMSGNIDMETFVLDVLNVIESEQLSDVILVGHSYGARSINGVADRIGERIRHLVYIDGGFALNNQSRFDAMSQEMREKRLASAMAFDGGISVPPPPAAHFGVTDSETASWIDERMTPQPLSAEKTAVILRHPIANGRPATYVRCISPIFPTVEPSAAYSKAQTSWNYLELEAGHDAIVTHPSEVAALLLRTAGNT